MESEIKFISINRQSVEFTKKIIEEIVIENDLIFNISFPQSLRFSRDSEGEGLGKPKY
jgi:hypothetical protein